MHNFLIHMFYVLCLPGPGAWPAFLFIVQNFAVVKTGFFYPVFVVISFLPPSGFRRRRQDFQRRPALNFQIFKNRI